MSWLSVVLCGYLCSNQLFCMKSYSSNLIAFYCSRWLNPTVEAEQLV